MPKKVDHDARRLEIVEALFRIVERDGLAAATYRAIAAEAGIKAAQVQYYFPTKRELFEGAMFELGRRVVGRGLDLIARAGPDPSPEVVLRAALEGASPTDDARRQDLVLFYVFLIAALSDEHAAESGLVTSQRFIIESFADVIRRAKESGDVSDDVDPIHEARLILFGNTGVVLGALLGIYAVDDATATLDYFMRKLFPRPAG